MDPIQTAALVAMIISFLPLGVCLVKIHLLKKYKAKATITTALITASEKRRGAKNSTYYLLDIKYIVHTGVQYSAQTISLKKYSTGDSMPLMYLTDKPGNFKTDFGESFKWLLPISIILIVLAVLFCYWLLNLDYYSPSS